MNAGADQAGNSRRGDLGSIALILSGVIGLNLSGVTP